MRMFWSKFEILREPLCFPEHMLMILGQFGFLDASALDFPS